MRVGLVAEVKKRADVQRSTFVIGFSRVQDLSHLAAAIVWGGLVIFLAIMLYHTPSELVWPYSKMWQDPITSFLVFLCLGLAPISFLFQLPIVVVKFLLAGFVKLDDEGIPEGDWLTFRFFAWVLCDIVPYLSRLFAWLGLLAVLYFFDPIRFFYDNDQKIEILRSLIGSSQIESDNAHLISVRIAMHTLVMLAAVAIRFYIWVYINWELGWPDKIKIRVRNQLLGEERYGAVIQYAHTIAERNGIFPLIKRLLSI